MHVLQQPRGNTIPALINDVDDAHPTPHPTTATPSMPTTRARGTDSTLLDDDGGVPSSKARPSRIKSLDQLVDETDRIWRAYTDGQMQRWIDSDQDAPHKVGLVIAQLRQLLGALTELADAEQWPVANE
jgi:hypothetical protein